MSVDPRVLAAQINKFLGSDVVRMGNDPMFQTRYVPTGVLPIDVILNGGFPRNRTVEIYGGWSTLKSYIGLRAIASCQRHGGTAALIDTEHAYDRVWAHHLGVDIDSLILPPTTTGEDACDATEILIRNGVDLIVWDSVAATMPQDEARKRLGGKEHIQPGRQAALMSAALRRITSVNSNTALVFINQTREKVGIVWGSPETTPGGKALPFYASYRIALRKGSRVREDMQTFDGNAMAKVKRTTSQTVHVTLEKSKLSAPGREYLFQWDAMAVQIDEVGFLMAVGIEQGLIKVNGQRWSYGPTAKNGKAAFRKWLETNEKARMELTNSILPTGDHELDRRTVVAPRKTLRRKKVQG